MTDHYDTLGVPRDAAPSDIKAAFRRLASSEHPDKGGDAERMAAVNRAYETLGDEQRRAEYDATGGDNAAERFETEARNHLLGLFDSALLGPDEDILRAARQMLGDARMQIGSQHDAAGRRAARLRKQRDRVLRKGGGENLFTGLVDSQLQKIDAQLAQMEHGRKVFARVAELLEAYEMAPGASAVVTSAGYAGCGGMFNIFGGAV